MNIEGFVSSGEGRGELGFESSEADVLDPPKHDLAC
jgi:hypothetical protein